MLWCQPHRTIERVPGKVLPTANGYTERQTEATGARGVDTPPHSHASATVPLNSRLNAEPAVLRGLAIGSGRILRASVWVTIYVASIAVAGEVSAR